MVNCWHVAAATSLTIWHTSWWVANRIVLWNCLKWRSTQSGLIANLCWWQISVWKSSLYVMYWSIFKCKNWIFFSDWDEISTHSISHYSSTNLINWTWFLLAYIRWFQISIYIHVLDTRMQYNLTVMPQNLCSKLTVKFFFDGNLTLKSPHKNS